MTGEKNSLASNSHSGAKAWVIVITAAIFGCAISAAFPQFSLTVWDLSHRSGIPVDTLLVSDTVKSIGIILSMMCSGFAYRRFGVTPVFAWSLVATAAPQFLMPWVNSVVALMVLKVFQGTAALIFPVFLVIIMERVRDRDRGLATAVFNGVFYSGGGAGGALSGMVQSSSSWVYTYFVLGLIMIILGALWYLCLCGFGWRKSVGPEAAPNAPPDSETTSTAPGPREKSAKIPFGRTILISIGLFAATFTIQAVTVDMPVFSVALGYDSVSVAQISIFVTVAMILGCVAAGKVSDLMSSSLKDRETARLYAMLPGYMIIACSVPFFMFGAHEGLPAFCALVFALTFGGSFSLGAFYPVIPDLFEEKSVPVVTGIAGGTGDIGMPVAPLIVGVAFGIRGRWDLGWGSCLVFAIISTIAIIVLLLSIIRKRRLSNV